MATRLERVIRAATSTVWAIEERKLYEILAVLQARARGEAVAPAAAARPQRSAIQQPQGVAVLPVYGTISQRMGMLEAQSGGTSTEQLSAAFDRAMADDSIGAIVLDVDSPGGSVYGVEELSAKIYAARGRGKRIVAVANSLMASAAYYIASAADEVVVTPSGEVGSIGVFALHLDYSQFLEQEGIKPTIFRAGQYKAELNPYEPVTEEAAAYAQAQVDEYYRMFVAAVARNRGVATQKVLSDFGQGRTLLARDAVAVGLADRIATLEEVLAELGVDRQRQISARAVVIQPTITRPAAEGAAPAAGTQPPTTHAAPKADREDAMQQQEMAAQGGAATEAKFAVTVGTGLSGTTQQVSVGNDALAAERKRAREIMELAAMHGMADRAAEWIESGRSAAEVGLEILRLKGSQQQHITTGKPPVELTERESRQYSIRRAILAAADNDWDEAGFELEVHQEIERKLGRPAKGVYVPTTFRVDPAPGRQAALGRSVTGGGSELVFTEPGSFIELLRSRIVTVRMGARFLTGLQGDVAFPRQTGSATLEWRPELPGSDQADSQLTLDQLILRPKEAQATTAFSRKLLAQAVLDVEQLVRDDFAAIAARGIDRAALHGSGTGNEPTGIYAASGVNAVPFGGTITYERVVEMETAISEANADIAALGYVTTPRVRGKAKVTQIFPSTANGTPLWTGGVEDGEMNGYRAMASTQVRTDLGVGADEHGLIFGAWSELIIGEWGAMEVIVDPYSKKKQGLIEVTLHLMADVGIRHPQAFAKATGLIP